MAVLVGYMRVSTAEQSLALQRDALAAAGCERFYEDTCGGTIADRPGLARALETLRAGDALVVWKLDRIGRSLAHVVELLAGSWVGVAPLLVAWAVHLGVGLFRHVYDTRVFTLVYADLATDLVERQRARGADAAHLAARVALSREVVDFLQVEVPSVAASVVHFTGAVAMLCVLDLRVGALAVAALLPVALFTARFGRTSLRLNAALNDRLEREVELVARGSNAGVRRHFAHRLRFWRVRISDAEAKVWGANEVVQIALTLAALALLAREGSGATAGAIYSVLAYVWAYGEGVGEAPGTVQKLSRLRDIASRLG
jgi:ABC transporter transmembrane region/Resolvase, N terminal domain